MTKTALITGSNRGIGFETARQLGQKGFRVIISGRDISKVSEAASKLIDEGIDALSLQLDVTSPETIRRAVKEISGQDVRLDVLINNAAILRKEDKSLVNDPVEILDNTLRVNCYGPLFVIRELLPVMNKPGRIINISSEGGSMSDPVGGWSPAYCVSKTLLNSVTRQLANELSGENITVNAVCPGWVKTRMGGRSAKRSVEKGAETPVWLASEAPQYLTGKFFRDKKEIPW